MLIIFVVLFVYAGPRPHERSVIFGRGATIYIAGLLKVEIWVQAALIELRPGHIQSALCVCLEEA